MSSPQHHASAEVILSLAEQQSSKLQALQLHERPFVLCMRNTVVHAATLKAAADLRAQVVLAPNGAPPVLALAASQAGVELVVEVAEASGEVAVVAGPKADECLRRWTQLPVWQEAGVCAVSTSGSSQEGSKLVAYRWAAGEAQARATAQRTLKKATPGGGRVRFVAASSIGHAYNLNGFFSALAAGAEVCLPADAGQLAHTLSAEPMRECEATVLFATPQMYSGLLHQEALLSGALATALRAHGKPLYAFCAGCPLAEAVRAGVAEKIGVRVLQNYGTSETGNIALEEIRPEEHALPGGRLNLAGTDPSANKGVPWGDLELRKGCDGRLLPASAEGEVVIRVDWVSEGYLVGGQLVPHSAAPFVCTGDAGRRGPLSGSGLETLVVMQRLRQPIEVWRDGLRLLVQPYEVEEALLRANPGAEAAAALQGPSGRLLCAVACAQDPKLEGALQPDSLVRLDRLPTSPAGKVLYSLLYRQCWPEFE